MYRATQIRAVAVGMLGVLLSLAGSSLEMRWLALTGMCLFVLSLASIFVVGFLAWWHDRRHGIQTNGSNEETRDGS